MIQLAVYAPRPELRLAIYAPPPHLAWQLTGELPAPGRCLVAFVCEHPFEARCNPRTCGEGRPVLRRVWTDDYRPAPWRHDGGPPHPDAGDELEDQSADDAADEPDLDFGDDDPLNPGPVPRPQPPTPTPLAAHPEPEIRARTADPDEIPTTAAQLVRSAGLAGWTAQVRYARGTNLSTRGRPLQVVESVIVRLEHPDGHRASCEWINGKPRPRGAWLALARTWRETLNYRDLAATVRLMTPRKAPRARRNAA